MGTLTLNLSDHTQILVHAPQIFGSRALVTTKQSMNSTSSKSFKNEISKYMTKTKYKFPGS